MIESKLAAGVVPSIGRHVFNLAAQMDNVIDLTLGDPDLKPDELICRAGCDAIAGERIRYSANAGMIELRKAYSDFIYKKYNVSYNPKNQIAVTVGGMEALYLAILSAVNPGDEVIIFAPYYINYFQMINMCGGIPVVVDTLKENCFVPEINKLENKISDKTKMIIINNPSNPTGAVYSYEVLKNIIELAKEKNILVISDEVYGSIVYDGTEFISASQVSSDYEDVLIVDSCSKRFSMTGWRIGFAAGPKNWIDAIVKLQENVAACAPLHSQYAALNAYISDIDTDENVKIYKERRDALVNELKKSNKLDFMIPKATFYLFVNIGRTNKKSMDFAIELLRKKKVAVVPGVAYGENFDNYVRIAYTLDKDIIKEAAKRIVEFVEEIR